MKYIKEILAAVAFAVIYFVTDQYWLHKDRTIERNLYATGVATVCYFILTPLVKKWLKRGKAKAEGDKV